MSDKFFIEGVERKNLRNIITREMIANTLIHREFTSAYTAKFVIEKDKMYTENANRSSGDGIITPDNMEPNPKNPIIASFFRNIGWSDRLGSGVRNIFKYSKYYSGEEPEFIEGDVFRIIVPLNEEYSYDNTKDGSIDELKREVEERLEKEQRRFGGSSEKNQMEIKKMILTDIQKQILDILSENNQCSAKIMAEQIGVSSRSIENNIKKLKEYGILERYGSPKNGYWEIKI
nr:ATP-binding protein [uncultured Anaerostipes sp.]